MTDQHKQTHISDDPLIIQGERTQECDISGPLPTHYPDLSYTRTSEESVGNESEISYICLKCCSYHGVLKFDLR